MSQFFNKNQSHRILLLLIGLCVILLGGLIFAVPPGTDPDPCWGFMIMNSMAHGGRFNLLVSPAFKNIAENRYEFLAWWSPGQYLLPYFFRLLLKVTTGQGVSLTIAVCSLLGLAGYYKLFTRFGFTKWVSAISTAFIATQLFFIVPFTYFLGGEQLIFAFAGWFLYGCFSFKKITVQTLVFVFIAGLVGFFAKSSFLWMYAAGIACIWINISLIETGDNFRPRQYTKKELITWLKNGTLLAIPFIGGVAAIYIFYLSKGATPASDAGHLLFRPETFGYPLASPALSAFSVDEFVDGLIYQPGSSHGIVYHTAIIIVLLAAVCSLAYLFFINSIYPDKKYKLALCTFYIIGVVFFTYMYLKQATISYEGRHFRIIGLLCIPGIIYLLFKTKATRVLFFIAWLFFANSSYHYFIANYRANKNSARANTGLTQGVYDQATLDELVKIDKEHSNAIFVLTSSDIAAEVYNNRVITFDNDTPDGEISRTRYSGKAGPLFIIVPKLYLTNGRKDLILKTFKDYPDFASKQLSANYYLYYSVN